MNVGDAAAFWSGYLATLSFAWGACVGSFLNVCVYRIPLEQSVITPRSHCPGCNTPIAWYDNIPLFSYIVLRARCRSCGIRISPRYVLIELLTAVLFLLVWFRFGVTPGQVAPDQALICFALVLIHWLVVSGLILGTFVDFEHLILPDRVTIGGMIAGVTLSALVPALHGGATWWEGLRPSLVGLVVGFGLLWGVAFLGRLAFRKEAMGFGDVKLMGAIGAFFGWQSVLFSVMVSSLAGSVVGITLIALRRKELQSRIPFGPYLALATILWFLCGAGWWNAYVSWLTGEPIP